MTRAGCIAPVAVAVALAIVAAAPRPAAAQVAAAQPAQPAQPPAPGQPVDAERRGHVYLSWVRLAGAESCPDVRQIADDVARRLGWNPFRESPTQFIEAQIRRQPPRPDAGAFAPAPAPASAPGGAWAAEIFLRDASGASRGNRVFTSGAATCTSLASVVALSIAIVIDPDVMLRRFSDDELWSAAADPVPAAQPPRPPAGARGTLVALGGAALGLLPRATPGLGLAGEVRLVERLSLRVGTLFVPETRTPDDNFAFGLTAGWLGACVDGIRREVVALGACAAGLVGRLHPVVYSPDAIDPGERPLWGLMAGLRLSVRLAARVEGQLGSDGLFVLNRRQFTVTDRVPGMDVAWTQPPAAALLWAALGVRFR